MPDTINNVILYRRNSSETSGVIKICVYDKTTKKQTYISLKESVLVKDFDAKLQRVKRSHKKFEDINFKIEQKLEELDKSNNDIELSRKKEITFIEYSTMFIDQKEVYSTQKKYITITRTFVEFLNSRKMNDIFLSQIDFRLIELFHSYLIKKQSIKSQNTKYKYLALLKAIINSAIEKNYVNYLRDPFLGITIKRLDGKKVWLDKNEIISLLKLEIDSNSNIKLYTSHLIAQFQFFSQGTRISDALILKLKDVKNNSIEFQMNKTKKNMKIIINEQLKTIIIKAIDLYDFDKTKYDEFRSNTLKYILQLEHQFLTYRLNPNDNNIQNEIIEQKEKLANEFNLLIKEAIKQLPKNSFIFNHFLKVADFVDENTIFSKFQTNQISSKTAIYNKLLKNIGKLAEIETPLTSHIFRHSFANMALTLSDDIYSISKTLGHSSLKQTEEYLRDFDLDKVNKLNEDISHSFNRFVVGKNPKVSFDDFVELTKATNDI